MSETAGVSVRSAWFSAMLVAVLSVPERIAARGALVMSHPQGDGVDDRTIAASRNAEADQRRPAQTSCQGHAQVHRIGRGPRIFRCPTPGGSGRLFPICFHEGLPVSDLRLFSRTGCAAPARRGEGKDHARPVRTVRDPASRRPRDFKKKRSFRDLHVTFRVGRRATACSDARTLASSTRSFAPATPARSPQRASGARRMR